MIEKNQVIKNVKIIDYTHEGLGVGKIDNFAIFVKYAKLGETIDVKITKKEKKYAYAIDINQVEEEYICKHYKKCGGCHVMHLDYNEQLNFKKKVINNVFNMFKIDTKINDVVENDLPFGYRNKILMPFTMVNNKIELGFFKSRSHDIEPISYCHLQSKLANDIMDEIKFLVNQIKETVYNEDKHQGNLRHLYLRQGYNTDEIMVCFILNSDKLKQHRYIVETLVKKFPQIKSVVINVNKRKTNAVLGYKNFNLYNSNFINEKLEDLTFRLLPNAFFQINTKQTEKMYDQVVKYADIKKDDKVLDAFCGVGSITLYLARTCEFVTGIEISEPAIKSANDNRKINNVKNVKFICNDIEEEIQNLKINNARFDVVVVDPPRKGLEEKFVGLLNEMKPRRIVYVSCNPATLARDLISLSENYIIEETTPFDLFSQTFHVETVTKLTLK